MKQQFHYATVTEAIEQLRAKGFTLDLNLKQNQFMTGEQSYPADEFEIVDLYRYEGASDPGDEATVLRQVRRLHDLEDIDTVHRNAQAEIAGGRIIDVD